MESWQETVRAGALGGLAALKDPRALDIGLKYAAPGNPANLRVAAFSLLGELGKGDDRALQTLFAALKEQSIFIRFTAAQALGAIADARAVPVLEEMVKSGEMPEFAKRQISAIILQIKNTKKQDDKKH
jgi:aminopeptidase N